MKPTILLTLLVTLTLANSLEAKWQRFPIAEKKPVNAGISTGDAKLDSSTGIGRANSLLSEDVAAQSDLAAGNSNAVIALAKLMMISSSTFVNDGIEGKATLSGSADKKGWAVLDEKVFTSTDREVKFAFAGMQVKFVKVEFALSKGGSIRSFQLFGSENDGDYTVKQSEDGKSGTPVNFASIGGSRVIYATPKPENGMENATAFNKFSFPESDERYRTIIYDLGQLRIMNEFGSVHSPRPVRFEVFAFDQLPEKEDWKGRLAFDPAEFNVKEPVATAEDTRGLGYVKAKPTKSVKTRFVAMRWEPDFNPPTFTAFKALMSGFGLTSYSPGNGGPGAGLTADQKSQLKNAYDDSSKKDQQKINSFFQGAASLNGIGLNSGANSP